MKYAYESVGENSQCLVVEIVGCLSLVVERSGTGLLVRDQNHLLVQGIVETPVAEATGDHGVAAA